VTGDRQTIEFYDREAPRYTLSGRQAHSPFLDAFLDRLEPGAHVLELGSGAGKDAAHILERGFTLDATDASAGMARKARERFAIDVRVMRFEELEAESAYDAVWAHASLHHEPFASLPGVLARICRALRPGGWHFANFKLGEGDARDEFGRLYNFPPRADLLAAYEDVPGWHLVETDDYRDGGLDKVLRDWIALTVRKEPA
jgi:SAM-dependent methyltransferase